MKINNTHVFFFQGIFSNWFKSDFSVQGLVFNCVEQYMMYKKAMLFGDKKMANKIMGAKEPNRQKALGRLVLNFDDKIWKEHRYNIVYEGNYFKYTQNLPLLKKLIAYKGKSFVEASPYDEIWGIKMGENHPDVEDPSKWRGLNLLGDVLTDLTNDVYQTYWRIL